MKPSNANKLSQLIASRLGARLWRMNNGLAWTAPPKDTLQVKTATTVMLRPGDVLLRNGHPVKMGVVGMSDGGGFVPVVVSPEMVGQTVAIYLAVEDKSGSGRPSPEQAAFIAMVRSFGGRAGVSRCEEDTKRIIAGEIVD